jgi:predicted acylesterase/phospholipase RssA
MKYYLYLLSLLLILSTPNENFAQEDHPKIGLVLSGGGARGFAHIGTLKLIDSLQIPIDYIVGTSMGGIIGGLYASGYTGNEIEKLVLASNWVELLEDQLPRSETPYLEKKDDSAFFIELGLDGFKPVIPSGFVSGQLASLLLADLTSGVGTIRNFNNLPIPFKCVAVDLVTGSEVVLQKGSLAKAMRATMSLPSIFSPVEWGDSLLIDGGMLNNFPSDVLREMGTDVIIGVNIGSQLAPKEELNNLVDIFSQTMVLTDFPKQRRNYELCDLIITPDLGEFTTLDFENEKVKNIIQRGIRAASENKNQLLELKKKYVYDLSGENIIEDADSIIQIISAITISGETSYTLEYLYELIGHSPSDTLDVIMLKDNISKMKTSGLFKEVEYEIQRLSKNNFNLHFKLSEKKQPLIFGFTIIGNENLHFDFIISLLGSKPGDPFDKQLLNKQIKYMFGLGYFENITYILEPVRDNYIRVIITVKEKPIRKLRLGIRYDDRYKVVGTVGIQVTNTPIVGLRGELFVQFAGLFKFDYFAFYPSRTLNFPLYPYIRIAYKDIPLDVFNENGDKWAEYNDKSWTFSFGVGHAFNNIGRL